MATINGIIGRQREIALLQEIYESPRAEFVAVYGRRRIGKTYLIDKFFGDKYDFYMTGIYEGTRKEQLANFAHQLEFYSHKVPSFLCLWHAAFYVLYFTYRQITENSLVYSKNYRYKSVTKTKHR